MYYKPNLVAKIISTNFGNHLGMQGYQIGSQCLFSISRLG